MCITQNTVFLISILMLRQIVIFLKAIIYLYSYGKKMKCCMLKINVVPLCTPPGVPTVPLLPPQVSQSLTSVPPVNPATTLPGEQVKFLKTFLKQKAFHVRSLSIQPLQCEKLFFLEYVPSMSVTQRSDVATGVYKFTILGLPALRMQYSGFLRKVLLCYLQHFRKPIFKYSA